MAIGTHAELKTAIAEWLDRDDLTDLIDNFIVMAEPEIFDDLRIRQLQKRADITMDGEYIDVPSDFVETIRFHISDSPIWLMKYRSPEQLNDAASSTAGKPDYYTVIGAEFQFNKTPGDSYTGKLVYYSKPTGISSTNTTNTVLTNYPNIYVYSCLVQAEPFLGNDPRMATWKAMRATAINKANSRAKQSEYSGSSLQVTRT